ncbi:MAG: hypothetical protein Q4F85_09125 [Prevotella sp.]|nr:hypothetical protein [Prevotella sp.]
MERDIQLDCYRSLTMMYIVCVIHTSFWFYLDFHFDKTLLLIEMPVIFFIAGASQSFKKVGSFRQTIINRSKRVLLPYYIFLGILFLWFYACTLLGISFEGETIDITQLNATDIIKLLATGGSEKIPYLGYTWFISCYMIVSCSLPLQRAIMKRISEKVYAALCFFVFTACCILNTHSPENILENVLCYNVFYISGYVFYKQLKKKQIILAAILPIIISTYLFANGRMFIKFPPDLFFLFYNIGAICILSIILSYVKIPYSYIIRLWNVRGYNIFLYQSISLFIVYKMTEHLKGYIHNDFAMFIILFIAAIIVATSLSYFTFYIENRIIRNLFPQKQ